MGLLDQMRQVHQDEPVVEVLRPQPVAAPVPAPEPAPAAVNTDLKFERDPGSGLIDSAVGYDRDGNRVKFEFVRDGLRRLENIKVKR